MLYAVYGKGGSGKSTLARYLLHRASQRGEVRGFDADASNGSLTRFYKKVTVRIDDPHPEAQTRWYEEVVWPAAVNGTAVLDLGSGAERGFQDWAAGGGLMTVAREAGVPVRLVGVLDPSKDALSPILGILDAIPDGEHVLVRNRGRVKPGEGFEVVEGHAVWARITARVLILDMPVLAVTMPKLDALNATFADALAGCVREDVAQLGPFDRQRVAGWLRTLDAAWEGL